MTIGFPTATAFAAGATLFTLTMVTLSAGPQQAGRDERPDQVASVDFVVVSRDGQPVTDLKAEEITLRVGNRTRTIRSLQYVRVPGRMSGPGAAAAAAAPEPPAVAPAFFTNIAATSDLPRSIVIVVDDESIPIGQEQKLRTALTNFVRDLPPTDQVALVTVPHGGIKVGLTADRARLNTAIGEISPISSIEPASCRTRTTLSTLETTLAQLARTSQQPVTVAFLSQALVGQSTMEASQQADASAGRGGVSAQAGGCYLQTDDFVRIGEAVAAARAQLYIIHPDYSQNPVQEGVENLRGQTGAPLFHLTSSTEPGLYRMARETSGYYVATFDTAPEERTGKTQPASIRTTRKDVDVRARPYVAVGRATAAAVPAAAIPMTAFEMVRSGRQFRDLPLRATASSFRNPDGTINVIGWFEPIDPSVKIMTASAALIDENGKGIAMWQGEADKMTSWPTAVGLTVVPGNYRMRIGAIDSNGRMGLVDGTLIAEIRQAGSLQISGLALGLSPGGTFMPRLQFSKEREAVAYLELYGAGEGAQVGAIFELARTTNGPAMLTVRGTFAPTNLDGKFGITGTIPLANLAPGDYVVRALVGEPGKPAARVVRTLNKVG
jgi:hypothetical protein